MDRSEITIVKEGNKRMIHFARQLCKKNQESPRMMKIPLKEVTHWLDPKTDEMYLALIPKTGPFYRRAFATKHKKGPTFRNQLIGENKLRTYLRIFLKRLKSIQWIAWKLNIWSGQVCVPTYGMRGLMINRFLPHLAIYQRGWGSQGKPWLDRKNPNTDKGRLAILDECNWKISYTFIYRDEQLVLLP